MKRVEKNLTIFSIFVGIMGIAVTIYSLYPDDKEQQKIPLSNETGIEEKEIQLAVNSPEIIAPSLPRNKVSYHGYIPEKTISGMPRLIISGNSVNVTFHLGEDDSPYLGGEIYQDGSKEVIYLPKNYSLYVEITGEQVKLNASRVIASQIYSNQTAGKGSEGKLF